MKRILTLALLWLAPASIYAQVTAFDALEGSLNDDGFVVISGTQDLIGIELKSPGGYLVADPVEIDPSDIRVSMNPSPSPFDILIASTPTEIVFGNLGVDNIVSLDGSLVLDAQYSTTGPFDLTGKWGGPLDNEEGPINFTAPIPEPSTGSLSWAGVLAIGVAIRRCSNRA